VLGEIRENLAIELDMGLGETIDELVVREAHGAGCGANLDLPQAAEDAFLFFAIVELKLPCMQKRFLGGAILGVASPHKTLRMFQQVLPALICLCSSFDSWHG